MSIKRSNPSYAGWALAFLLIACAAIASGGEPAGPVLDRVQGDYTARITADGLDQPHDVAFHPFSGDLYVSEEQAGRIVALRGGLSSPVIDRGWSVVDDMPQWLLSAERPKSFWLDPQLHRPGRLAFSRHGNLFVLENIPDGRLLEFVADDQGQYRSARIIPVPWLYKNYLWQSLCVSRDGLLCLSGASVDAGPGVHFGAVLLRDLREEWWIVDYAPFGDFSTISLSADHGVLVVGDSTAGTVTWWDLDRHRAIGTLAESLPQVHHTAILPNGAIAVSQRLPEYASVARDMDPAGMAGGRLQALNPRNGGLELLASGLGAVRSLKVSPHTGFLYLTEAGANHVLELRPKNADPLRSEYLLKRALSSYEMASGLPPKQWPPYLKGFFDNLGINVNEEPAEHPEAARRQATPGTFTLRDVGKAIPIVAGTLRTRQATYGAEKDPIQRLDFIILFPNRMVRTTGQTSSGVCLFAARRESGKIEQSRNYSSLSSYKFQAQDGWRRHADQATVYLPLSTCSVWPRENGDIEITVSMIGLGEQEDYFIQVTCGKENSGQLVVDDQRQGRVHYDLDFTEYDQDGVEYNSLVVSGINRDREINPGWMPIGKLPLEYAVSPEDKVSWTSYSMKNQLPQESLPAPVIEVAGP